MTCFMKSKNMTSWGQANYLQLCIEFCVYLEITGRQWGTTGRGGGSPQLCGRLGMPKGEGGPRTRAVQWMRACAHKAQWCRTFIQHCHEGGILPKAEAIFFNCRPVQPLRRARVGYKKIWGGHQESPATGLGIKGHHKSPSGPLKTWGGIWTDLRSPPYTWKENRKSGLQKIYHV